MANITWISSSSSSWSVATNWDTSTVPTSADTVFFNGASAANCTIGVDATCYDMTVASSYLYKVAVTKSLNLHTLDASGVVTSNSGRIISSGSLFFNLDNGSNLGPIKMTGSSAILYIANFLTSACSIEFSGLGDSSLIMAYTTSAQTFKSLSIGASTRLTHSTLVNTTFTSSSTPLSIGSGASYTLNSNFLTRFQLTASSGYPYAISSDSIWNGTGSVQVLCANITSVRTDSTLQSLNYTGTGSWSILGNQGALNSPVTFQQAGDLNFGSASLTFKSTSGSAGDDYTYNTNSYALTCGDLTVGSTLGNDFSLFVGSSVVDIASYNGSVAANPGYQNINFQSSNWTCSGNWGFGTLSYMDPGTSTVTFDNSSVINNSKVGAVQGFFYDVTCNAPGEAITFATDTTCHDLTLIDGTYSQSGNILTVTGDARYGGYGSINLGNGIITSANDATISIASTVSYVSASSCSLTMSGSASRLQIDRDATLQDLALLSSAGVRVWGNGLLNLASTSGPLALYGNNSITLSSPLNLRMNNSGIPINILSGSNTITGDSTLSFDSGSSSVTLSISAQTWGGTLNLAMRNNTAGISNTIQLTGPLTTAGNLILNNTNTGTFTFNSQTNAINAASISYGGSNASGHFISDFGSSNMSVVNVNPVLYNLGINSIKFNKSTWVVSGNWIYPSSHSNTYGWSTVTFTGDSTVTCNGQPFNWLYLNAPGHVITLADDLICREYKNIVGTLNTNGHYFRVAGYFVEIMVTE